MEPSALKEQSWKGAALSRLGLSAGMDPSHSFPSFFLEGNSTNSPKLSQTYTSPLRQSLVSLQAEDLSLTAAAFDEPDGLSSLKSCPSFPAGLCHQGDQGKASKSLGKQPAQPELLQIPNSSPFSHSSACSRPGWQPLN